MKAAQIAKITDFVIDVIKANTKLKRRDIKSVSNVVLFSPDFPRSENKSILFLNKAQTEQLVYCINNKYKIDFFEVAGKLFLSRHIDEGNDYKFAEIIDCIINGIAEKARLKKAKKRTKSTVQPFNYIFQMEERLNIEPTSIELLNTKMDIDPVLHPGFWNKFDEWYMKNKKRLIGKKLKVKKKVGKKKDKAANHNQVMH